MNGLGLDECLRLIGEKRKRELFFALSSSLLPHSYQCYLALVQRIKFPGFFSLHRTHKMSMVPTVPTSTVLPTTHSLFRLQEFLAVSWLLNKSLSLYLPGFPQAIFYALGAFPNLIVFPPLTLLPKLCANVSSLDCLLSPLPNSLPSSVFQSRLQEQFLLLYQLLAIAIIYF